MKISCNIIEDLLPLYVDDMVSEDSRQLVEEHLKACPTCRRMQEEIMRENHLTDVKKGSDSVQINKMEAELLKKIRCKIRKKRIASVLLAVAIVLAAGGIGHYWYYDKENYISWDEANISVKDEINSVRRPKKHVLHAVRNHVDPQRISIRFKHRK